MVQHVKENGQDDKIGDKKDGRSMATVLLFFSNGAAGRTLRLYSTQILPARRMHDVCQVWAMRTYRRLVSAPVKPVSAGSGGVRPR